MTQFEKDQGISVEKYTNKIKEDLEMLVNEQGVTTVILGNRRTDPYSDSLKAVQKSTDGWPDFMRIHPILDWTYNEVWKFIKFFNFSICSLYGEGYTSLGLVSNTRKNPYLLKSTTAEGVYEYYPAW